MTKRKPVGHRAVDDFATHLFQAFPKLKTAFEEIDATAALVLMDLDEMTKSYASADEAGRAKFFDTKDRVRDIVSEFDHLLWWTKTVRNSALVFSDEIEERLDGMECAVERHKAADTPRL